MHPDAHWQRLESWASVGTFDSNACRGSTEIWVENKESLTRPRGPKDLVKAKVRPSQVAWEHKRREAGGRTFIAILVKDVMYILPGIMLKYLDAAGHGGLTFDYVEKHQIDARSIFDVSYATHH